MSVTIRFDNAKEIDAFSELLGKMSPYLCGQLIGNENIGKEAYEVTSYLYKILPKRKER